MLRGGHRTCNFHMPSIHHQRMPMPKKVLVRQLKGMRSLCDGTRDYPRHLDLFIFLNCAWSKDIRRWSAGAQFGSASRVSTQGPKRCHALRVMTVIANVSIGASMSINWEQGI